MPAHVLKLLVGSSVWGPKESFVVTRQQGKGIARNEAIGCGQTVDDSVTRQPMTLINHPIIGISGSPGCLWCYSPGKSWVKSWAWLGINPTLDQLHFSKSAIDEKLECLVNFPTLELSQAETFQLFSLNLSHPTKLSLSNSRLWLTWPQALPKTRSAAAAGVEARNRHVFAAQFLSGGQVL